MSQPAPCEKCKKRRVLGEYIDILTQLTHWLCWACACGK
jgi:hypothetical protein